MWERGFRFLFALDAIVLFATMSAINLIRFGGDWPTYEMRFYFLGFAIATTMHLVVNYFAGLYERDLRLSSRPWLPRVTIAMSIGVAFDGLFALMFDRYLMPRLNLIILAVVGSLFLSFTRVISGRLADLRRGPVRLVAVGPREELARCRNYLNERSRKDFKLVAEVLATASISEIVATTSANEVLLLDHDSFANHFPEPLLTLHRSGVGVHQRVSAAETLLGLSSINEIGGIPFTRLRLNPLAAHQFRLKRIFDLAITTGALPLWILLVSVIAMYSRMRAGRGVFYRQVRIGRDGNEFTLIKFRTMVHNAEQHTGPILATANDPRIVSSLRWLRATRLDELPQLFNVLRGEMSLVGPRPERPSIVRRLEKEIEGYERRHQIPPGITGLAQTRGRYNTDPVHKLGYDLQYLVNWSLMLDILTILNSIPVVIRQQRSTE